MRPFATLAARAIAITRDDIDTDQIIPARYLVATTKVGLGAHAFADWRAQPGFALAAPGAEGAQVLISGANFGCGSSREHAVWALADWGFRAVIARSFADIFRQNATKNGLLPIALRDDACAAVERALAADPALEVTIDLPAQMVRAAGADYGFAIDAFAKHCLVTGLDQLGYILTFADQIADHERRHG